MKSGSTKSETKVARLRCERGLTQAALAEKTGVNIQARSRGTKAGNEKSKALP